MGNDGAIAFNLLFLSLLYEMLGNINVYVNGVNIGMSTLCRHLKLLGLFRWKDQPELQEAALFLQEHLNQDGMLDPQGVQLFF